MSKKLFCIFQVLPFFAFSVVACNNVSLEITPEVTATATNETIAEYKVVFQDDDFAIRELRIGDTSSKQWTTIPTPESRIDSTNPSLDVEFKDHSQPNEDGFRFVLTIRVPANDNSTNLFELESEYAYGNGMAVLRKNRQVIWEGFMDGGTGLPVHSFFNFNGEIIFSYTDYSHKKPNQPTEYVVYSEGDKTIVIPAAFAPFVIMGEAVYFQRVDGQVFMVRNTEIIGESYDRIEQPCCGYESTYGILHNERIIDFFATRNNNLYHVQVGFQP